MTAVDPARVSIPFREASVDLDAIRRNTAWCAHAVGGRLVADLGGDAFGHGAIACAPAVVAGGAHAIAVPTISEAVALRSSGIAVPIAAPFGDADRELADALAFDVTVIAASVADFDAAVAAGVRRLGLRIETGSGLPGVAAADVPTWEDDIWFFAALPSAGSAARDRAETALEDALEQVDVVGSSVSHVVVEVAGPVSAIPIPATSGCVGAELFGVRAHTGDAPVGTAAAMTLWAPVVSLKSARAGEGVSYGFTYRTSVPSTLALVSLGYGDGIDRAAGNVAPVSIGERRYRISGRVAMDAHVVDLGADDPPAIGDPVVLFGDQDAGHPSVEEWAAALGVTSAEVTTRLTDRVRRSHR